MGKALAMYAQDPSLDPRRAGCRGESVTTDLLQRDGRQRQEKLRDLTVQHSGVCSSEQQETRSLTQ